MTMLDHDLDLRERTRSDAPWVAVVWDDPVNLMSYVTYVFQTHFGFPRATAERLMRMVNDEGKAIVASGQREEMERHVEAMHGYGLNATVGKDEA
jgi:ATP-dependent Clp protease adaptor protein ClpS